MTGDAPQDDQVTDQGELDVPHPLAMTLAELREAREVFHIDVAYQFTTTGNLVDIDIMEALAFTAFRRQGLPRAKARREAEKWAPWQLNPVGLPEVEEDDDSAAEPATDDIDPPPNPESPAT